MCFAPPPGQEEIRLQKKIASSMQSVHKLIRFVFAEDDVPRSLARLRIAHACAALRSRRRVARNCTLGHCIDSCAKHDSFIHSVHRTKYSRICNYCEIMEKVFFKCLIVISFLTNKFPGTNEMRRHGPSSSTRQNDLWTAPRLLFTMLRAC